MKFCELADVFSESQAIVEIYGSRNDEETLWRGCFDDAPMFFATSEIGAAFIEDVFTISVVLK